MNPAIMRTVQNHFSIVGMRGVVEKGYDRAFVDRGPSDVRDSGVFLDDGSEAAGDVVDGEHVEGAVGGADGDLGGVVEHGRA